MLALGVQRVSGHGDTLQVKGVQQGGEAGDFVGLCRNPELGDGHAGAGHRGQQVRGRGGAQARAAGALAVQGEGVTSGRVVAEEVGQAAGAGVLDDPADRRTARRDTHGQGGRGAGTEPGQDVLRGFGRPLADRHETRRTGNHGGTGDQQHCHEGVTLSAPAPRIGQCPQPLIQRADRTVLTGGRLDQTDGGRLTAHRSSVAGRRLGKVTSTTELRCVRSRTRTASSYRRDLHIREITTTLQSPCPPTGRPVADSSKPTQQRSNPGRALRRRTVTSFRKTRGLSPGSSAVDAGHRVRTSSGCG